MVVLEELSLKDVLCINFLVENTVYTIYLSISISLSTCIYKYIYPCREVFDYAGLKSVVISSAIQCLGPNKIVLAQFKIVPSHLAHDVAVDRCLNRSASCTGRISGGKPFHSLMVRGKKPYW